MSTFNMEAASTKLQLKTPGILQQALTHRSYLQGVEPTNDRLQLLGAQVLKFTVAESAVKSLGTSAHKDEVFKYISKYTDNKQLAQQFDTLGLTDGLRYTTLKSQVGIPAAIKAKAFESIIGAICHDKGTKAAQEFVSTHLFK
ncbi:unnamed protein product [Cunninghamella blakesleeana]